MKVIKRNTTREAFDITKIINVLQRANDRSEEERRVSNDVIKEIASQVSIKIKSDNEITTDEIEKLLETSLIENNLVELTRNYMIGCYEKKNLYHKQELDEGILGILDNSNEDVIFENSNKNHRQLSTQRDLIAGEVSKDLAKRIIFDNDVIKAHERGEIHIHDLDYVSMKEHNCSLINLKDMFEHGTSINGVAIDTPKSLQTACTIASQIAAVVSSSQFGLSK